MKKFLKPVIYIFVCTFLAAVGFRSHREINFRKEIAKIRQEGEERILAGKESRDTERLERQMSDEDEKIVDEHLLGDWEFSERIIPLEEEYDGSLSFSEQGLEELKNIIIDFKINGDYFVGRKYDDRDAFSNPGDVFLFKLYAGFSISPTLYGFRVERNVDEDRLGLRHIISREGDYEEYEAAFPGDCELVHLTYDMSYDTKENPVLLPEIYPAASVYIDLDDDETIYLDFCGLWKMKRVSWETTTSPGKDVSGLG